MMYKPRDVYVKFKHYSNFAAYEPGVEFIAGARVGKTYLTAMNVLRQIMSYRDTPWHHKQRRKGTKWLQRGGMSRKEYERANGR